MSRGSFPSQFRKCSSFFSNRNINRNYGQKNYKKGVVYEQGYRLMDSLDYLFRGIYRTTKGKGTQEAHFGLQDGPSDTRNPWVKSPDI